MIAHNCIFWHRGSNGELPVHDFDFYAICLIAEKLRLLP